MARYTRIKAPKGFKPLSKWDAGQIVSFVLDAVDLCGGNQAWEFVGPQIRANAIKARALDILMQQYGGASYTRGDVQRLHWDMAVVAGTVNTDEYAEPPATDD